MPASMATRNRSASDRPTRLATRRWAGGMREIITEMKTTLSIPSTTSIALKAMKLAQTCGSARKSIIVTLWGIGSSRLYPGANSVGPLGGPWPKPTLNGSPAAQRVNCPNSGEAHRGDDGEGNGLAAAQIAAAAQSMMTRGRDAIEQRETDARKRSAREKHATMEGR